MTIPLQFASLYDGQEVFVWSSCLLDLGTDFLVGNMVFVIIIIIINPLTARVVGAPQMILQPVFSIFPCLEKTGEKLTKVLDGGIRKEGNMGFYVH